MRCLKARSSGCSLYLKSNLCTTGGSATEVTVVHGWRFGEERQFKTYPIASRLTNIDHLAATGFLGS